MAELLINMLYVIVSTIWASIYHIFLSAMCGLERLKIFETAIDALISTWPKLLSSLAFAAVLLCLSMKFPQPIRPTSDAYMLAMKDFEINIANNSLEELVQEYEMLLENSERDRKYAEEICKERQPLNAQKTFLENNLGDFESFSELERKFKDLEWQLEAERQLTRDEDKERHRLFDMAQLANSEVILARNSTAALNLEWQVAKLDHLEREKVVGRQRHDAALTEAASQKELRAMRRMTGNDQTVDEGVRLGDREINRLRMELMNKTTICDAQLAAKDKKIHDLELSLKSAELDYANLEESFGLGGLLDEGAQEAEKTEGVEVADGAKKIMMVRRKEIERVMRWNTKSILKKRKEERKERLQRKELKRY